MKCEMRKIDNPEEVFSTMKVGDEAEYNGFALKGFYWEDDYFLEPDILGGVDVYKGDTFIGAAHNPEELEKIIIN